MRSLVLKVGAVALVQLALVGVAVAPRLSARLTGDEYRLRVQVTIELDGGGSYASETTRMFKVVALPRGGDRYRVHVDPHDQHRWLLDTSRRLSDA